MVIPTILTTSVIHKNDKLVKKLQKEARMLFYNRMMYDINDSLTSILAVCDEGKEGTIPKIKDCINRINLSLNNTKKYQSDFGSDTKFDINLIIKNLIRVIKENNRNVQIKYLLPDIKVPALGNRSVFEELLLNIFVDILGKDNCNGKITIELKQNGQNVIVSTSADHCILSNECIKRIIKIKERNDFLGDIQIKSQEVGVSIIIRIPLQFNVVKVKKVNTNVNQMV